MKRLAACPPPDAHLFHIDLAQERLKAGNDAGATAQPRGNTNHAQSGQTAALPLLPEYQGDNTTAPQT